MKPLVRLGPLHIRCFNLHHHPKAFRRIGIQYPFTRSLATLPPDPRAPENEPSSPTRSNPPESSPTAESEQGLPATSQSQPKYPQAYTQPPPPPSPQEYVDEPISSRDWYKIERDLTSIPETTWSDTDNPVPLNKDWPLTSQEYDILPNDEKARIAYEDWQRKQLDFVRKEKLNDHVHLHPLGSPFNMPMVSYHRNHSPEGTTPPPIQHVPWQLRRPWSWIRKGGIGLFLGVFLASIVAFLLQHGDEWTLRRLEGKSPAPKAWPEKARGYYAMSLNHKNEGKLQLAVWALQRALVEAGYQWIIDPKKVPESERLPLDLESAWVVRTLMVWETDLKHWDKALTLMEGLSTVYEEENPLNWARRSDLLRVAALPTEKAKGVQAAAAVYRTAISFAGYELPKDPKEPIILPQGMRGHAVLLRALEDYIIFQVRHGMKTPKQALPTLLSIATVYRETPYSNRDVCSEGAVQLHIGEILYALGHKDECFQWTETAVKSTRQAMSEQTNEDDARRCSECVGNGCNSLGILFEVSHSLTLLIPGTW
jgi:hypothetical protein